MNQRVVRFDIRVYKDNYISTFWDEPHRSRFLLRPAIEWPLSVDPLVWPSVFYSQIFKKAGEVSYGSIEVDPSTDDGKYWRRLAEMRSYYETHKEPNLKGVPVAVQIFSESDNLNSDELILALGERADPSQPPLNSEFLGFDVADLSGISGLSNCGYSHEEKERLAHVWAPRLNAFGLLTTFEHAAEFRLLSDRRVPDHSPFWVYGLTRMPATE